MRRTFLLLACLLLTSLQGWSETVVYDSIYYEIDEINHEARVTYYAPILGGAANGLYYKGDIVIPEITFYKGEIYPVTGIGHWAFHDCPDITSVSIPSSVKEICHFAFMTCMGLTSITIPKNVTTVYGSTFRGCTNMESIVVENGNTVYDSRENCNAIIETATNTLLRACNSTVFPAGVTSIGASAFSGLADLTSFSIPESVTTIGSGAFSGCTGLTSITIPKSVTSIGYGAFSDCI